MIATAFLFHIDSSFCNESILFHKESFVFTFEVGCEHILPDVVENLLLAPETSTREFFLVGCHFPVMCASESINQFTLLFALIDILSQWLGIEVGNTQLFVHLPFECLFHMLAEIDVASTSRIPFARLYILPFRSFLQVEFATTIEKMQVDDGMKGFRAVVCFSACDASQNVASLVDQRKQFFLIVFHSC